MSELELVEFLKSSRTLKSQIEILSKCNLSEKEKNIIITVLKELTSIADNYLERNE